MPTQIDNDKESGFLTTHFVLFRIMCDLLTRQFVLISAMVLQPMSEIYSRLPTFVLTSHGMPSSGFVNLGKAFEALGVRVIKSTTSNDTTPEERYNRLKKNIQDAISSGAKVIYYESYGDSPDKDIRNLFRKCRPQFLKVRFPNTFRHFATCLLREWDKEEVDVCSKASSKVWTVYRRLMNKFRHFATCLLRKWEKEEVDVCSKYSSKVWPVYRRLMNTFRHFVTCLLRKWEKEEVDVYSKSSSKVWTVYRRLMNKFEETFSNDTTPTEEFLLFICQKAFGKDGTPKGKRVTDAEINELILTHGRTKWNSVYTKMMLISQKTGKPIFYHLVEEVSSNDKYSQQTWEMLESRAERVLHTVTYEWKCIIQQIIANRFVQ